MAPCWNRLYQALPVKPVLYICLSLCGEKNNYLLCSYSYCFFLFFVHFSLQLHVQSLVTFAPALLSVVFCCFVLVVQLSHIQYKDNLTYARPLCHLCNWVQPTQCCSMLLFLPNALLHILSTFQSRHFVMLTGKKPNPWVIEWAPSKYLHGIYKPRACRNSILSLLLFLCLISRENLLLSLFSYCNWQLTYLSLWSELIICEGEVKINDSFLSPSLSPPLPSPQHPFTSCSNLFVLRQHYCIPLWLYIFAINSIYCILREKKKTILWHI